MGPRGARVTVGRTGMRQTVGLPGTGLWYTRHQSHRAGSRPTAGRSPTSASPPVGARLSLGFFQKLFTPKEERALVEGMKDYAAGRNREALTALLKVSHLADAAFMAATLAVQAEDWSTAERMLLKALQKRQRLGHYFRKYGLNFSVLLRVTVRISAEVYPSERGSRLILAEVHQALGEAETAVKDLRALLKLEPSDAVVRLSLVELLVLERGDTRDLREAVKLTGGVENKSEVEAALLLWRGKALLKLGLATPARDALTQGLRRRKDRSPELLLALRRERIRAYEALGAKSRARSEREILFAECPDDPELVRELEL